MASIYLRHFNLKVSLSDSEVASFWRLWREEVVPAIQKVSGVRNVRVYSGAGALRADLRLVVEMDHAGVYEVIIRDAGVGKVLGPVYGAIDLTTSSQMFLRELNPDLLRALGA